MKYIKLGKIKINGRLWEYGWGDAGYENKKPCEGKCDYDKRRIVISKNHACQLADVVSHEVLHARFPEYKEDAVNDAAEIISNVYGKFLVSSKKANIPR
jgi:hypothetical protein